MGHYIKSPAFWVTLLSITGLIIIGSVLILFFLVNAEKFGSIPDIDEIASIELNQSTLILSSDGETLGTLPLHQTKSITLDEINPNFIDALISIEDIRFHNHKGIDYRALGRVAVRTFLLRQNSGGGSTITQQLAKNLFPRYGNKVFLLVTDKIREMIIAHRMESIYTKEEILELYLNSISFGEDTIGLYSASFRFFNKHPLDLSLAESATLAGVLRATTYYNPFRNQENALRRRNIVLRQMEKYQFISVSQAQDAIHTPLITDYRRRSAALQTAPYFLNYINSQLKEITDQLPALDGKQYQIDKDRLIVHTSLNSAYQEAAEKAVTIQMKKLQNIFHEETINNPIFNPLSDPDILSAWRTTGQYRSLLERGYNQEKIYTILHTPVARSLFSWDGYHQMEISPYDELKYYLSFLNSGFVIMNPTNGNILAWVGGIDHQHFPYDQVLAKRQPGSAFKPIVYAAALENGSQPCDYLRNQLTTFASYDDWTPRNHQDEYGGYVSLQAALSHSLNTVTVLLGRETGISAVHQTARLMGIDSRMTNSPSLSLGTSELSLLELTTAYSTFLNSGRSVKPRSITRIYNSDGELIYDFEEHDNGNQPTIETDYSLSEETASAMVVMLEKAINEGTGSHLRDQFNISHAVAGKTGTTQHFVDGWFVGFTSEIVFGARVGGYNHRVRFQEFPAYASQTALPIVGEFLKLSASDQRINEPSQNFFPEDYNFSHDFQCPDFQDDGFRDRLRNFFSGRSSDEPVVIDDEEEKKESRNIFRRLGRRLGLSDN